MPITLQKLKILEAIDEFRVKPITDIQTRKRSTKCLWVGMRNGKPITKIFDDPEQVTKSIPKGVDQFNIQKLHPDVDKELISKIEQFIN